MSLAIVLGASTSPAVAAPQAGPALPLSHSRASVVPGELVVMFRQGVGRSTARAAHARLSAAVVSRARRLNVDVVRVPAGVSVDAALRRYQRDPSVLVAEPNRIAVPFLVPTDPDFGEQWALHNTGQAHHLTDQVFGPSLTGSGTTDADVDAVEAWDTTTGGTGPVVAVLDTGVDIDHPELLNSLWVNTAEQGGTPTVDDDANGFVDDLNGWDFENDDADPSPDPSLETSHGTHVAGIVAAGQNDGVGVTGICPGCRIMALRFDLTLSAELLGIDYAMANGADVINMSFGSPVWSGAEREAIRQAGLAGVLAVVAAGNSSLDNDIPAFPGPEFAPSLPASYTLPTIIAVAASNHTDQYGWFSQCEGVIARWMCGFSSWGHDSVDVAAPGVDIWSSVVPGFGTVDGSHDVWDGTSMAAPMVAGIAGLVLDQHPGYTPLQVKNAIMNSVDHPTALKLYTKFAGAFGLPKHGISGAFTRTQGRVNANAALTGGTGNATPKTDGNVSGSRAIGGSAGGRVAWPRDVNDVFRKRLRRGVRYEVVLDGPRGSDLDLWVWSPGVKEIWQFTAGCFGAGGGCPVRAVSATGRPDERVVFKARKTGVHYLVVNGFYSGGRYRLVVRRA